MTWMNRILAAATLMAVPSSLLAGDDHAPNPAPQSPEGTETSVLFPSGAFGSTDDLAFLTRGQSPQAFRQSAVRFGWWGIDADGSRVKTGEIGRAACRERE